MEKCAECQTELEVRGTRSYCPACALRSILAGDDPLDELETESEPTLHTPPPQPPTMPNVPRHHLSERLGEGGFSVVYRAMQREPVRREVAVKVLKSQLVTDNVLARFEAERQTLARMEHPGIARLWDAGVTVEGLPFFAMELVRGQPLTTYCRRQELGLRERLELFASVCDAVQHAHEKGVMHRDLKPSNLLAETDSTGGSHVKVIDFGIAKALTITPGADDSPVHTAVHQAVGTPGYMSPEQADWGAHSVDARSDIYALGVVLFELITGVTPLALEKKSDPAAKNAMVVSRVTPPSLVYNTLLQSKTERSDLDAITLKALSADPVLRYASAAALADDVRRHLADEPVQAAHASWTYVMSKFTRRHQSLVISTGVALFAILGGLAVSLWLFLSEQTARQHEQEARSQVEDREKQLKRTVALADFTAAQRLKRDGDHPGVVACLTRALRHDPDLQVAAADLQMMMARGDTPQPLHETVQLPQDMGSIVQGAVSADGEVIVVVVEADGQQRLFVFRWISGRWEPTDITVRDPVVKLTVSAGGDVIVWADTRGSVTVWKITTISERVSWNTQKEVTSLAIDTPGEHLAVGCADGTVFTSVTQGWFQLPGPSIVLSSAITQLLVGPKGGWILIGCGNGEVRRLLANEKDSTLLLTLPGSISVIATTSNQSIGAAGDLKGNVGAYRDDGVECMKPAALHGGPVSAMAMSAIGESLLSSGSGKDLRVRWTDIKSGLDVKPPMESAGVVRRIFINQDGTEAFVVSADSSVRAWSLSGSGALTLRKPQRSRFVASSTAGRSMALIKDLGPRRELEVLGMKQHIATGVVLHRGGARAGTVSSLAFGSDDHTLLVNYARGETCLWDTQRAALNKNIMWAGVALAVQSSGDGWSAAMKGGNLGIVSSSGDNCERQGDAALSQEWDVAAVAPDGDSMIWGNVERSTAQESPTRVWWDDLNVVEDFPVGRLSAMALHEGSHVVALGAGNGFVKLACHGDSRGTMLPVHQSKINDIAFSPDGKLLLTASTDETCVLLDAQTLAPVSEYFRLGESVVRVVFSGDGRRFACATRHQLAVGDVGGRALLGLPFTVPQYGRTAYGDDLALNFAGTSVALALSTGEVIVHDIAHPSQHAPEWFLDFSDAWVSRSFSDQGVLDVTTHPGRAALIAMIPKAGENDEWRSYAQWIFTHTGLRTLSPWSTLTMEQYMKAIDSRPGALRNVERRRLKPLVFRSRPADDDEAQP